MVHEKLEKFMRRALELAAQARGRTSPNPMVGAVIVKDGEIVGEGYHHKAGTPHAEIHAINNAGAKAKGAQLYVTLEPCCHHGRTPPCTEAIIQAGISAVVMAMSDPDSRVSGRGKAELEAHGVTVQSNLLEREARKLNEFYIKYVTTGLPFVILKSAMSLDGKIATYTGKSKWITSERSRQKVHELRDAVDAILVGVGTVINDNPSLTTRLMDREGKDAVRVIVDSKARLPIPSRVLHLDSMAPTLIAVTPKAPEDKISLLQAAGAEVLVVPGRNDGKVSLKALMETLSKREIVSVMIEGGSEINASALREGVVDKVIIFIAPKFIGGRTAPGLVGGRGIEHLSNAIGLRDVQVSKMGEDILLEGYI
ncbi:MAG: bifunctional diaminohydroxyphosphoribosylaminopyrimidine deaminase/5-amino-6-(5-phosphoribosylamino)uracil reductase RibD [Candidatus Poribacteria bacterium]